MDSTPKIRVPLIIVTLALLIRFVPGWIAPYTMVHFMSMALGPFLGLLGLLLWWIFARRMRWRDGLIGAGAALVTLVVIVMLSHRTMPPALMLTVLPLAIALVGVCLLVTPSMPWRKRRFMFAAGLALAFVPTLLFRMDGQAGSLDPVWALRWSPTAEERFLADRSGDTHASIEARDWSEVVAEWPEFRGAGRDGDAPGVAFSVDWEAEPPRELWRKRVGPAWSSFVVAGGIAFTQEQRGEQESVVAYRLADGEELWASGSEERFEEPQAGPGPRATPTYDDGRIFALGGAGTLRALDASDGRELWKVNLVETLDAPLPPWGFASSPLVVDDAVIVFAGAPDGRSLAAFGRDGGALLWSAGEGALSYASPQLVILDGRPQVLMASDIGLEAFAPDGTALWRHDWLVAGAARNVGTLAMPDGRSVILPTGFGEGTRRLEVSDGGVRELWTSRFLKPYFNDAVCHDGHCYGFDGRIFASIDASDGARNWKGGRYGHGQVMLVPELDVLLVLSESGEVVLVAADPSGHRELATLDALDGKTWNHPVIADGKLLVRNAEEAACFELPGS